MCLIPTVVLEEIGLSLPVFIKWDDSEYSLRARAAGYPTVSLPGSAVWHVSWADKDDAVDWQAYFHERNRMIVALLYSGFLKGGRMLRESAMTATKHTISMQYYAEPAVLDGIMQDVLAGPEGLHDQIVSRGGSRTSGAMPPTSPTRRSRATSASSTPPAARTAEAAAPRRERAAVRRQGALIPWTVQDGLVRQVLLPPDEAVRRSTPRRSCRTWTASGTGCRASTRRWSPTPTAPGRPWYQRDPGGVRMTAEGARGCTPSLAAAGRRWRSTTARRCRASPRRRRGRRRSPTQRRRRMRLTP